MLSAVSSSWALLLGISLIMLGNGLQGTLLGYRASSEGFSTAITGLVMTGYYLGFLAGSMLVPKLLKGVGHIRVFAALASLASVSVLLHNVFVVPWTWGLFRLITGFSYAGLFIVAESWLNDRATNETRGQLLAIYMAITFASMAGGQLLLNVADPMGAQLFILVSVLVSLALVPISITVSAAPKFDEPSHIGPRQLLKISPLGVWGSLIIGCAHGALFGMGAVYAHNMGLSLEKVSYFMAIVLVGGMLAQVPLGRLSDKVDRRRLITAVTFGAGVLSIAAIPVSGLSETGLLVSICLYGALSLPLYSLCVAYTNDSLEPHQMVAASGTLVLVQVVGASLGPASAAALMAVLGPSGLLWFMGAAHAILGIYAVYRMTQRSARPVEENRHYIPVSPRTSPVAIAMHTVRDHGDSDPARQSRY